MRRVNVNTSAEDGFSAVELLVVIVITAVVGSAALTSIIRTIQVSADATVRVDALTELQRAHERISRNVRAADPVRTAAADALSVTVHDNDQQRRQIDYAFAGDTITQTVRTYTSPAATTPASTDVTTVIDGLAQGATDVFTYWDEMGDAWDGVSVDSIARVEVTLIAGLGAEDTLPLTTSVQVRNNGEWP